MSAAMCKAIIDGAGDVSAMAGTKLVGNLTMVLSEGVEPTTDEANALMKAAEDYCRTVRGIVHGWIARSPGVQTEKEKKREGDVKKALDILAPPEGANTGT
jgi:hypothetical protein